jgi:porin
VIDTTDEQFLDPAGERNERRLATVFSADQRVHDGVGVFVRLGWQDDEAAVDFDALYSGGVDLDGKLWGRGEDNVGIGYAHVSGGNDTLRETHVLEAYYRYVVHDALALTGDVQHVADGLRDAKGPAGFVLGLRATVTF